MAHTVTVAKLNEAEAAKEKHLKEALVKELKAPAARAWVAADYDDAQWESGIAASNKVADCEREGLLHASVMHPPETPFLVATWSYTLRLLAALKCTGLGFQHGDHCWALETASNLCSQALAKVSDRRRAILW